jgi:hypothetical protein
VSDAAATGMAVAPFVPCDDYDVSRSFYLDLGFELMFENEQLARFAAGGATFRLQRYRWPKDAIGHFMLQLEVSDLAPWWANAEPMGAKYGVRVIPPVDEPWAHACSASSTPAAFCGT